MTILQFHSSIHPILAVYDLNVYHWYVLLLLIFQLLKVEIILCDSIQCVLTTNSNLQTRTRVYCKYI